MVSRVRPKVWSRSQVAMRPNFGSKVLTDFNPENLVRFRLAASHCHSRKFDRDWHRQAFPQTGQKFRPDFYEPKNQTDSLFQVLYRAFPSDTENKRGSKRGFLESKLQVFLGF